MKKACRLKTQPNGTIAKFTAFGVDAYAVALLEIRKSEDHGPDSVFEFAVKKWNILSAAIQMCGQRCSECFVVFFSIVCVLGATVLGLFVFDLLGQQPTFSHWVSSVVGKAKLPCGTQAIKMKQNETKQCRRGH